MKKYILLLIKISVSAIILYLILQKVDTQTLKESLRHGKPIPFIIGVLIGILFNIVKFFKWHILIKADNEQHTYWDGAKSYMIGNALGVVTPMRAGDLGRALYFKAESRPRVIGFTLIDRVSDLIAVILFCVIGAFTLINPLFGVFLLVLGLTSLIIMYHPLKLYNLTSKVTRLGSIGAKMAKAFESLTLINNKIVSISLLLSFTSFFLIIAQFYFVISAFDNISFYSAFLATPLVTLSSLIPITFMGLGVREGFAVYLFSLLGITFAAAFSTAFLCFMINNVSTGLIGIIFLTGIQYKEKSTECR